MYNLEATPDKGTTYRFAKEDRKRWPDILQAGTPETPYYTNSSQLAVRQVYRRPVSRRWSARRNCRRSMGDGLRLYMNEQVVPPPPARCARALEHFPVPYITVTPTFSICPTHGYLAGEHEFCRRADQVNLAAKHEPLAAA